MANFTFQTEPSFEKWRIKGEKFERAGKEDPLLTSNKTYYGGEDACEGDSGGPLYVWVQHEKAKKAVLVGSVSRGHGCAEKNKAGVYVKINAMLEWIKKQIDFQNFNCSIVNL